MNYVKKKLCINRFWKTCTSFLDNRCCRGCFSILYLYFPLIKIGAGDPTTTADFVLIIIALAFGGFAVISSIFTIPRNLWILLTILVFLCALIPVIIYAIVSRFFPYVDGNMLQIPYLFVAPTNPLLDFIGFWMAIGGSLFAILVGFSVPKK
jgi:hypothetical protein